MTKEPRLPADQAARDQAVNTVDAHQFLDAGAGCGKTRVLVEHYLKIIEQTPGIGLQQIIAVTFTNKAATEMKDRVRRECRLRATRPDGVRWEQVARDLEAAPIDTIHGLCSRILRENAVPAGVDPAFSVLEPVAASLLLEDVVRRSLLDRLDAEIDSASRLVFTYGLQATCAAIASMIGDRARMPEAFVGPPGLSAEEVQTDWDKRAADAVRLLLHLLVRRPSWTAAVATLNSHSSTNPDCPLEKLRQFRLAQCSRVADETLVLGDRLQALSVLAHGKVGTKSAGGWSTDGEIEAVADALRSFSVKTGANSPLILRVIAAAQGDPSPELAQLTSALGQEVAAAVEAYEAAKRRTGGLDFEDLQLKVAELWKQRPEVLVQYRARVRHVLIDEFQDTDSLQTSILWPLSDDGAKLFVVGDVKQSIYRFRNADVTVFNATRERMAADPSSRVLRLAVNFRSTPALAGLYNSLFSHPAVMGAEAREPFEARYEPISSFRRDGSARALEMHVVLAEDGQEADEESLSLQQLRETEARLLARRIVELVAEPDEITVGEDGRTRRPRYGDVAMLFRSTPDMPVYERALRDAGVPYYVIAGRGFYGRQEVRDVMSCLSALENRCDDVALVGTLRSPLFSVSDEGLLWLGQMPGSWWQRLQAMREPPTDGPAANLSPEDARQLQFAAEVLDRLRAEKNRMTLSQLVDEILHRTGLAAILASQFGGDQMVSNLRKLSDIAAEFEQSGNYSLRGLLNWLRDLVVREEREGQAAVREESSDVVKLLTIHAAKGLEWPIVLVPDLSRGSRGTGGGVYVSHPKWGAVARPRGEETPIQPAVAEAIVLLEEAEALAEARRVFYVACTRARDLLVLSSPRAHSRRGAASPLDWLAEAFALDLSQPGEATLGEGSWTGTVRIIAGAQIPAVTPDSGPRPDEAGSSRPPDPETIEALARRVAPLPAHTAARVRFNATELAVYLQCPRRYELRYLRGAPETAPTLPSLDPNEPLSPTELGDVVHRLLRIVGTGGLPRLREALEQSLGLDVQAARRLQAAGGRVRAMLEAYVQSPLYLELVAPCSRLRTEMTVLAAVDDVLLEGKIDALVEDRAGALHVLDYKTGRERPQTAASYEFQLGLYCAAVQRLTAGPPASARVLYLDPEGVTVAEKDPVPCARKALEAALVAVRGIREGRFDAAAGPQCRHCPLGWACR